MRQSNSNFLSLENEQKLTHVFIYLVTACAFSGIAISVFKELFSVWLQWNIIGHVVISALFTLPALAYQYIHFRRTVGIRKPGVLFTGLACSAIFLGAIVTGLHIVTFGQSEKLDWIPTAHRFLSYGLLVLIGAHIIGYFLSRNKRHKKRTDNRFKTIEARSLYKSIAKVLFSYTVCICVLSLAYTHFYNPETNERLANYSTEYGPHPFRPSLTETPDSELIHVNQIAKSEQCGACHQDIFEQWLSSTHRQAASDPTYVKNISLLVDKKGIAAARYCEGCHAPVALLTGELTQGGAHGGIKNTPAHLEGVGCMGCHGIADVVSTSGVASYLFSPKEHYLFDSAPSSLAQKVRNFLIQSSPTKHKGAMGSHPMSDPKMCATCHEQFMDKNMNDWGWVKMQGTYQEWLNSPFSGQKDVANTETEVTRCQDCHFALVDGNDPSSNKNGQVASHRSLGANTFLPILNNDQKQLELTKRFLQSSKVLIHIETPQPKNVISNKQSLENNLRSTATSELPYFLYLGDRGEVSVTVTNRLVGHSFPAGTTDLNQAWISLIVRDGNGEEVFSSGVLNQEHELDDSAHIYHSTPVDRYGKPVWKHDLFRMTGESTKNVIEAGKSDIKTYFFDVPSWVQSPLSVEAKVYYRKLNQRYAEWALDSPNITIPPVELARDSVSITIRERSNTLDLK